MLWWHSTNTLGDKLHSKKLQRALKALLDNYEVFICLSSITEEYKYSIQNKV